MPRKFRREVIGLFTVVILLAVGLLAFAKWRDSQKPKEPYKFPAEELAELDRVVQARFAVVPEKDFGMARIGSRHEVFRPQTAREREAIKALQRRNWDVVFYVASHVYLFDNWTPQGPPILQGPIFITQPNRNPQGQNPYSYDKDKLYHATVFPLPTNLPGGDDAVNSPLKQPAKEAYEAFKWTGGVDFTAGQWKVTARPVRVSQKACLGCHDNGKEQFKLGDTLGVAMYAYRPAQAEAAPQEPQMSFNQIRACNEANFVFMGTLKKIEWRTIHTPNGKIAIPRYVFKVECYWKNDTLIAPDNNLQVAPSQISMSIGNETGEPMPVKDKKYLVYATYESEEFTATRENCKLWKPASNEARALGKPVSTGP